jgi:hypothetical protein
MAFSSNFVASSLTAEECIILAIPEKEVIVREHTNISRI